MAGLTSAVNFGRLASRMARISTESSPLFSGASRLAAPAMTKTLLRARMPKS